ncbi:hypothetical protein LQ948_00925 [Jiella sp. MQZ9-1]|uniref:Lipoprotein n=1 Tax=Jiella flava TaxID=2816857 RepID=A0A939FXD5_9HYPH|nr:hypothetical protein [Jiella flava]MBO0661124.1 hypothetical protein [Jiella flava]MCD2469770.1 hypothetical protein [Jiella flava]
MLPSFLRLAAAGFLTLAVAGCTSTASTNTHVMAGAPVTETGGAMQTAFAPTGEAADQSHLAKPYFISFRARNAESYGHTFVVFGRLDQNGRVPYDAKGVLIPSMTEVAGLHPASTSVIPYMLGHVIPVPSETGASDGDTEKAYLLAEWTIPLTAAQYNELVPYIHKLQARSPVWNAVTYNCSAFVGTIARHMGFETPSPLHLPKDYINDLRKMNT